MTLNSIYCGANPIANAVADTAKSAYVEDVRKRKLTFAGGQGEMQWNASRLDLWGLGEHPAV